MDLKELSETVQQQQLQQGAPVLLATPKRPSRSLDKTIESCKAQLGTNTHTRHSITAVRFELELSHVKCPYLVIILKVIVNLQA